MCAVRPRNLVCRTYVCRFFETYNDTKYQTQQFDFPLSTMVQATRFNTDTTTVVVDSCCHLSTLVGVYQFQLSIIYLKKDNSIHHKTKKSNLKAASRDLAWLRDNCLEVTAPLL